MVQPKLCTQGKTTRLVNHNHWLWIVIRKHVQKRIPFKLPRCARFIATGLLFRILLVGSTVDLVSCLGNSLYDCGLAGRVMSTNRLCFNNHSLGRRRLEPLLKLISLCIKAMLTI